MAPPIGETPIGNYSLPIGSHEVVLRHPELGERRQTVMVGVGAPDARRRGSEEMTMVLRFVLVTVLALVVGAALAQDGLERIRQLYVAADYDGALAELDRLPPATCRTSNWSATAIGR